MMQLAAYPIQLNMNIHQNCSPIEPTLDSSPTEVTIHEMSINKPTNNDVLLGRGVATNRHPGNENFRAIVSQHVVSTLALKYPCRYLSFCSSVSDSVYMIVHVHPHHRMST